MSANLRFSLLIHEPLVRNLNSWVSGRLLLGAGERLLFVAAPLAGTILGQARTRPSTSDVADTIYASQGYDVLTGARGADHFTGSAPPVGATG